MMDLGKSPLVHVDDSPDLARHPRHESIGVAALALAEHPRVVRHDRSPDEVNKDSEGGGPRARSRPTRLRRR